MILTSPPKCKEPYSENLSTNTDQPEEGSRSAAAVWVGRRSIWSDTDARRHPSTHGHVAMDGDAFDVFLDEVFGMVPDNNPEPQDPLLDFFCSDDEAALVQLAGLPAEARVTEQGTATEQRWLGWRQIGGSWTRMRWMPQHGCLSHTWRPSGTRWSCCAC